MTFAYDSTNVKESSFQPLPVGEYKLVIDEAIEKTSKKGYPMVEVTLRVIENIVCHGETVKYYVVFIPPGLPGDAMNVHFRKCIGIPYAGDNLVNATTWLGKRLRAEIKVEERDYNGKHYIGNRITKVMPYGEDFPPLDEETPF